MKNCIVQIKCGKSYGTAFYISNDLLLTAYHTFDSRKDEDEILVIDSEGKTIKGFLNKYYEECDLALIKVIGEESAEHLDLIAHKVRIKEELSSYGFPDQYSKKGLLVQGLAAQMFDNQLADVRMNCGSVTSGVRYDGMSGAPAIWNDMACGVVIEQNGTDLDFISILKVFELLNNEGINIHEDIDATYLPEGLQENVDNSQPNYSVFSDIDESLNNTGKWHLLYGSPGCGKTTLVASYTPFDDTIVVLGRYFFKVPADSISSAVRCSERHFMEWVESMYIKYSNTNLEVLSPDEILKRIPIWISNISNQLKVEGKKGVLIVDGLDELINKTNSSIESFTRILNFDMPDNITVLLSCTSKVILPSSVISDLPNQNCIEVKALDLAACEIYINNNTGDWDKPYSFIQETARKTGGHPLYMNYLCKYISTNFDKDTKEEELISWGDSLPSIGGNIETYYNMIWQKINTDGKSVEILATLSQIRGCVTEKELVGMLSQNSFEFTANIGHLKFLLKTQKTDSYEFYHNSFNLYLSGVLINGSLMDVNDQIDRFCQQNQKSQYAIENELHHKLNGHDYLSALKMCDQDWADKCSKFDLSPDLILHDIRECLAKAVDECLLIEVARLMLLAQRIEFRYDRMFAEFATSLADINIALGKPNVALRYLIREDNLLIKEEDAIKYLRQLYDKGYPEQAHILFNAIYAKFRRSISGEIGESMSIDPFIAYGQATVELMKENMELGVSRFFRFLSFLHRIRNNEQDENSIKCYSSILSIVNSYYMASRMRFKYVPNYDVILGRLHCEWSNEFSEEGFRALFLYDVMNDQDNRWQIDIEYYKTLSILEQKLMESKLKYSKDELYIILNTMIKDSRNSQLTIRLISQYGPSDENLYIRKPNGVDVNWDGIMACAENLRYIGYVDDQDNYPHINEKYWATEPYWESYIVAIIKRISYFYGHICRKKADGIDIADDYNNLKETLDKLSFSFKERSQWKRSYLIPEAIFPYIYMEIATLYRDYFPDKINDFINYIEKHSEQQLSLYREGYVQSVFNILDRFTEKNCFKFETKKLSDIIKNLILHGVLNRYERTPNLLKLVHIYALLGEKDASYNIYQEMLNTSMGPDWYKEAQMGLLNNLTQFGVHFSGEQANHIGSIFEAAAGEMTFQRYVQQEQNEFVGNLLQSSSLEDAVAYYKFETLPNYEAIIHNAEDWKVDMPEPGNGYNLGANHLIEASAMRFLLTSLSGASPYIKYALSELFWDNADNYRYGNGYALIHKQVFESLEEQEVETEIIPRMVVYFIDNYAGRHEGKYLESLIENGVSEHILISLQKKLKLYCYEWNIPQKKDTSSSDHESRKDKLRNPQSVKDVFLNVKADIVHPQGEYWYSLDELLNVTRDKMSSDMTSLCDIFIEHFDLVVRPSDDVKTKFDFLGGYKTGEDVNAILLRFLLWFMIHPDFNIAKRAKNALQWLAKYEDGVISTLFDEIFDESEMGLAVKVSELLVELAKTYPQKVMDELKRRNIKVLSQIPNFSISRNLYEIGKELNTSISYYQLMDSMDKVIPERCADTSDIFLEKEDIIFVEHIIDKLNNLHVLDKDFAKNYIYDVHAMGKTKISQLIHSDAYAHRSFFMEGCDCPLYKRTIMNIVNRHLYGKIDKRRADRVYYAINL